MPNWGSVFIGEEIYGAAGPQPVTCLSTAYQTAQPQLDAQRDAWIASATSAIPDGVALRAFIPGLAASEVNAPLVLQQADGFAITLTPVDVAPAQGFASGSTALGVPAFADVRISGGSSGCTMQDNSPRPSSLAAGDYYFNQLNNLRGLNGIRFTFSAPVQAFGAFFGDLETSLRGTTAFLRLLDSNGAQIADIAIPSSYGESAGIDEENAQCDSTTVANANSAAQGLIPGCGNGSTRWIGFVSTIPVAQMLVVVGDNDPLPNGLGLTEKLSVMGLTVMRSLPTAEVTVHKSAPQQVRVGEPFNYSVLISNTSENLAAGIVLTDIAPAGIQFVAVTGTDCSLSNDIASCWVESLPAHSAATVLIRAVALLTTTVTNLAEVTASNDTDAGNNQSSVALTPSAALPVDYCAAPVPSGGAALVINEIFYRQNSTDNDEWVELYATEFIPEGEQFYLTDDESGSTFARLITSPAGGIPAGTYLVVHLVNGVDDSDLSDGVLHLYSNSGTPKLNNTGDNLTLYRGVDASGTVVDYVAYGASAAVNGPGSGWSSPNAPATAAVDQSIVSLHNGADTTSGNEWVLAGDSGTISPSSPGANNQGQVNCNVAISKSGPSDVMIGVSFDYTIAVQNNSPVTVSNVIVSDTQPSGIRFNSVNGPGCNLEGGVATCFVGALPPGFSQPILINATATQSAAISNSAQTSALSDTLSSDNWATHTVNVQTLGSIGDFVYLDSNNNGQQESDETTPINGVPVTLQLPDGSTLTTVSEEGLYRFPNLPAGTYTVTIGSADGYSLTSIATYLVTLGMGEDYLDADFGFTLASAQLSLTKQGAISATIGETFPYTLQVTNPSATVSALDVVLRDTEPAGIAFLTVADEQCLLDSGQVTCNLGQLVPLSSKTVIVMAIAESGVSWLNHASVESINAPPASASWQTTVQTPTTGLRVEKSVLEPADKIVQSGDRVIYQIAVKNTGESPATPFTLLDRYDDTQLLFQSASITPTIQSSGILSWTFFNEPVLLQAADSLTLTVTFIVK